MYIIYIYLSSLNTSRTLLRNAFAWLRAHGLRVKYPVKLSTDNSLNKSMGNEKKISNSQDDVLRDIVAELKKLKECVGKTVKNDELKTVITSTIKEILNDHKVKMEELWDEKNKAFIDIIDAKKKNEIENLKSKINEMTTENEELKNGTIRNE